MRIEHGYALNSRCDLLESVNEQRVLFDGGRVGGADITTIRGVDDDWVWVNGLRYPVMYPKPVASFTLRNDGGGE